jgi:hypothetical protein
MPMELRKAHEANDRVVDAAYKYKNAKSDPARVAFLFGLYERLTSLLPSEGRVARKGSSRPARPAGATKG